MDHRYFKGWAKPGPLIAAERFAELRPEAGETLDGLSGDFKLFQLKNGHRFSTDDVVTAWYGTSWCPRAERVLDLGSGIGSVALVAAWRLPGARLVTVEAQAESVALARKSVRFNGLGDRVAVREGDFRDAGVIAPDERFDLVLGSPPYFPLDTGVLAEHPQKIACRFEVRGDVTDYCATAARHLDWGGVFACIFPVAPEHQRERVLAGARAAGLAIVRQRPIVLREGDPPLLSLFAMTLAAHLPERMRAAPWCEPPLVIRNAAGDVHPEYAAIKMSFGFPPT